MMSEKLVQRGQEGVRPAVGLPLGLFGILAYDDGSNIHPARLTEAFRLLWAFVSGAL